MSDQKISELTALTGANVADDDAIAIVDTSATETKKIVFSELKNALDTATGFVRITGDTMTGNLSMGDNVKAIFGAGSDLQIYHNGSHSYIQDVGTGRLYITTNGDEIRLTPQGGGENGLRVQQDGAVNLYYDNGEKLATTSTGIDVTGTVTADGLTMGDGHTLALGDSSEFTIRHTSGGNTNLSESGSGNLNISARDLFIQDIAGTNRLKVDGNLGVISFFEDTGTTAKLVWTAADESLGIGGAAGTGYAFDVTGRSGYDDIMRLTAVGTNIGARINLTNTGAGIARINATNNSLALQTGGTNAIFIDSSQNVGIGTSSPSSLMHLTSGSTTNILIDNYDTQLSQGQLTGAIEFYQRDGSAGGTGTTGKIAMRSSTRPDTGTYFGTGSDMSFFVSGATNGGADDNASLEALTIRAGGNVGIGTNSPTQPVHLSNSSTAYYLAETTGTGTSAGIRVKGDASADYTLFTTQGTNQFAIYDNAAGSERFRIDSAGNVGIGVVPQTGGSTWQHIQFGGTGNLLSRKSDTTVDAMFASNYYVNASNTDSYITTGAAARMFLNDSTISFDQAGSGTAGTAISWSEAMRIDSSGNLLVGTTSTSLQGQSSNTGFRVTTSGTIQSAATSDVSFFNRLSTDGDIVRFQKDGTTVGSIGSKPTSNFYVAGGSGDGAGIRMNSGAVMPCDNSGNTENGTKDLGQNGVAWKDLYLSGNITMGGRLLDNTHIFANAANTTEYARIDSSGNLLVGTTDTTIYNDAADEYGFMVEPSGQMQLSANNATMLYLNRQNGDGDIIDLRRDGAPVASIGTNSSSYTYITNPQTNGGGISFGFSSAIMPVDNAGAFADNSKDVGSSSVRFKDLYLSGGVYLGGTGSANKLDDYESGSVTLTMGGGTSNPSTTQSTTGQYIKVGSLVTVWFKFSNKDNTGASGVVEVDGLPFTVTSLLDGYGTAWGGRDSAGGTGHKVYLAGIGTTSAKMIDGSGNNVTWSSTGSGTYQGGMITYRT